MYLGSFHYNLAFGLFGGEYEQVVEDTVVTIVLWHATLEWLGITPHDIEYLVFLVWCWDILHWGQIFHTAPSIFNSLF